MASPIQEASAFYAEDLGIDIERAERIAWFMSIAKAHPAIESCTPWAQHGKIRVYMVVWSQNSLQAMREFDRAYYDADQDDVFFAGYFYGRTFARKLSSVSSLDPGNFSGAKTRTKLRNFSEVFYEKKAARG